MTKVSIIIPTHNRAHDVLEEVESLALQITGLPFEIIVVDSASSPEAVEKMQRLKDLPQTQLLRVDQPGASLARNRGIAHASGEWLAFLDDDIIPHPDWAQCVLSRIAAVSSDIGFIGCRVDPSWPSNGGEIMPEHLGFRARMLLSLVEDHASFDSTESPIGISANMLVRATAMAKIGGFPEKMGRVGTSLASGEDPYVMHAVVASGYRSWYDGGIAVDHKIAPARMTPSWLARRAQAEGAVTYRRMKNVVSLWLCVVKSVATLPVLAPFRAAYSPKEEWLIRFNHNLGVARSALGHEL